MIRTLDMDRVLGTMHVFATSVHIGCSNAATSSFFLPLSVLLSRFHSAMDFPCGPCFLLTRMILIAFSLGNCVYTTLLCCRVAIGEVRSVSSTSVSEPPGDANWLRLVLSHEKMVCYLVSCIQYRH